LSFTVGFFLFGLNVPWGGCGPCPVVFSNILPSMWRKQHVSASWNEILDSVKGEGWRRLRHLWQVYFTTVWKKSGFLFLLRIAGGLKVGFVETELVENRQAWSQQRYKPFLEPGSWSRKKNHMFPHMSSTSNFQKLKLTIKCLLLMCVSWNLTVSVSVVLLSCWISCDFSVLLCPWFWI